MIEFATHANVAAAPVEICQVMIDIAREAERVRAFKRVEFVGGVESYTVVARMRRSGRFLLFDMSWESELAEFEPVRLVVFKRVDGAL